MAEKITDFLIGIGLDPSDLEKGLNNVVGDVKSSLSSLVTGAVMPALAGLAGGELFTQMADEAAQIDRLGAALNMNVEDLSAWRSAAEMAGVEADEVGEIFADFNDWMVDASFNEGGAMYTDFISKGLLPAVTDANGELKKTDEYILEFADALKKMDPAQASGIARQIGVSDLKTATWLQQGGDAIRQQLEQARKIGTYTKEDTQAARQFQEATTMLGQSVKMMLLPAFRVIAPLIRDFIDLILLAREHMLLFVPAGAAIGVALGVQALGGINALKTGILDAIKVSRAFIFSPWGALIAAFIAIGALLDDFNTWLNGGESMFGDFYESIFGDTEQAKATLQGFYDSAVEIFHGLFEQIGIYVEMFAPHFQKLWESLKKLFSALGNIGGSGFDLLVTVLSALGEAIVFVVSKIGELTGLNEVFAELFNVDEDSPDQIIEYIQMIIDALANAVDFVANVFNGIAALLEWLTDAFNTAIDAIISVFTWLQDTISSIASTIMSIISAFGSFISGIFSGIEGVWHSLVGAISSGASTIIGWISNIFDQLSALAQNSMLGRIISTAGGFVSGLVGGGGVDNSSTVMNQYNYGSSADAAAASGWSSSQGANAYY